MPRLKTVLVITIDVGLFGVAGSKLHGYRATVKGGKASALNFEVSLPVTTTLLGAVRSISAIAAAGLGDVR